MRIGNAVVHFVARKISTLARLRLFQLSKVQRVCMLIWLEGIMLCCCNLFAYCSENVRSQNTISMYLLSVSLHVTLVHCLTVTLVTKVSTDRLKTDFVISRLNKTLRIWQTHY